MESHTRQNKAGTWKSHHHWELALHAMLLWGCLSSSFGHLWTSGLYDTNHHPGSSCIDLQLRFSDWFALRKWQLVSQIHTLRSSTLWPGHSCQFQPSHYPGASQLRQTHLEISSRWAAVEAKSSHDAGCPVSVHLSSLSNKWIKWDLSHCHWPCQGSR